MYKILGIKILTTGKRTSGASVNSSDREKVNFDYITNRKRDMHGRHARKPVLLVVSHVTKTSLVIKEMQAHAR